MKRICRYFIHILPRPGRVRHLLLAGLLLTTLLLTTLAGCQAAADTTGTIPTTPDITAETTEPADGGAVTEPAATTVDRGPSGTLRVWWSTRKTLNPLLDRSQTGQAAATLVFDRLIDEDETHVLQPVLASSWTFNPNGLQLTVILRPDVTFQDGQPLTARDVKACLDFILANPDTSPFAAGLAAVSASTAVNDYTLLLQLKNEDPWLLYALDFPVVPARALTAKANAMALIAGTGRYKMVRYSKKEGLVLTLARLQTARAGLLQTIVMKEYPSAASAMKALENDQLDLVSLTADELAVYTLRNSLRLERYTANRFVMLAFNTSSGPMADTGNLAAYKQLCQAANWQSANPLLPGEATDVPVAAAHASLNRTPVQTGPVLAAINTRLNPDLPAGKLPAINGLINILAPADNPLLVSLANQLKTWLKAQKQSCRVRTLDAAKYQTAMANKLYDIALCEIVLPDPAEPGWLYQDPPNRAVTGVADLAARGLADYNLWRNRLVRGQPLWQLLGVTEPADAAARNRLVENYHQILTEAAARSPYSGILLREAGLAYGSRVSGQCRPTVNQPYQGIEDLWVWSGSSSSSY